MFFFPSLKEKLFFLTIISATAICFFSAPIINAQTRTETDSQNFGAIDPLLYNFREQPENTFADNLKISKNPVKESILPTAGELDNSFDVPMDFEPGEIRSSARQADGKIIIGGFFRTLSNSRYKSIARLNPDNSLDSSFSVETNGTVFAIVVQTDGKILIGGSFTVINGTDQRRIARLNPDGSLDSTFDAGFGTDKVVYDIVLQPDGKIIIGGSFDFVNDSLNFYVARLNTDGSVDTTFRSGIQSSDPSASIKTSITRIALQSDGKLLLIGTITLDPADWFDTTPIVRLNADGTIDSEFDLIETDSRSLIDVVALADGKILIAGFFNNVNAIERKNIARLNSDGSLDASFDATASVTEPVSDIYLKADGKILVGLFVTRQKSFVKQLDADGSTEIDFVPNGAFFGEVYCINITSSGKVFAGGHILQRTLIGIPNTAVLFNPDGSQDTSFALNSTALGGVRAMVVQADGKIVAGGNFNRVNGVGKDKLVRLNTDGTVDESFPAGQIGAIQITALLQQPDGKIIIGGVGVGTGTFISGSIIRVNPDGSADPTFNENSLSIVTINALALQDDGKILVAYANRSIFGNQSGGSLVRLNADGSLDDTFTASLYPYETIAVQPDGKILAGGAFGIGVVPGNGEIMYGIFRLNADGTTDGTFSSGFDRDSDLSRFSKVYSIKLKPDGKIIVGGELYIEGIASRLGVARLDSDGTVDAAFQVVPISSSTESAQVKDIELLPNGKILAGGRFNDFGVSASANIARFNVDGSADNTFNSAADSTVYDVEFQNNGKVLIGGDFEFVKGVAKTSLARLLSEPIAPRPAKFDFDGDNRTDISIFRPAPGEWWYLRSSDNGNRAFQFGASNDKITPADFTGDGKTDIAFFRESTGDWFILRSEDSSFFAFPFGTQNDIPTPGDFDGDGKADAAVFRPSIATWFILNSSDGSVMTQQFGLNGDVPIVEDYDGDGKDDLAIFRPSVGEWYYRRSSDLQVIGFQFGANGDKAVPADFTGDGKADIAFWRPTSGYWFILRSEDSSFFAFPFGVNGDIPVAGDYDGDGQADAAVFRPSNNTWYLQQSSNGFTAIGFGLSGDKPVPSAYIP